MASEDLDNAGVSSYVEWFDDSLNTYIDEATSADSLDSLDNLKSAAHCGHSIPNPPPMPAKVCQTNNRRQLADACLVPKETKDTWDKLFKEGYGADVIIITENYSTIPAHYCVLSVASPVLRYSLLQAEMENGIRYLWIAGAPYDCIYVLIRFLYSSCYDRGQMEKFVLHLLVFSHSLSVPSLKKACINLLEQGWLTTENVIDVLQLARKCDAPRLSLICVRLIVKDFITISSTEGWRVMKQANPELEQELVESVVEAESRKQERLKKIEEKKVYLQLYEAMEALVHICKDGCRTIGPVDKDLRGSQVSCTFTACKGIETLFRHFSGCKHRVPGGCAQCKRMWQLLELHSGMCSDSDDCKVPLCRHLKEKMKQQNKKDEVKWTLLVSRVKAAKIALGPFSSRRSSFL